ncbi:PEPxxWA-CTERM sorting domain-containing protein [Sandarakinorhabdus sp.]|uniref:PEPxxWA-CTERM sorting domain-containing protein n=1 Tax=Sandarakinorhabdus sp. TaxID=1916663 RepID=UPI00286E6549|nr:PEPxxWA-CTERM sorting domain-containing protein [Sandarakinorhabdus sp.]
MRGIQLLAAAAAMAFAMPALAAVTFNVGIGSPVTGIPGNNNFQSNLNTAGLYNYTAGGATITLSGKATVTFEFLGSESGFNDSFSAAGGTIVASENSSFTAWGPVGLGSATYNAGAITDWLFSSSGGAVNKGVGSLEFGIFLPRGAVANGSYSSNILYLGFDDQIRGDDDNHDDMIIRVTAEDFGGQGGVPEPASWAMLIAGFGLVGAVSRRRRGAGSVAA